jgi:hypothetical protein
MQPLYILFCIVFNGREHVWTTELFNSIPLKKYNDRIEYVHTRNMEAKVSFVRFQFLTATSMKF